MGPGGPGAPQWARAAARIFIGFNEEELDILPRFESGLMGGKSRDGNCIWMLSDVLMD